jgi:hypothetical protein
LAPGSSVGFFLYSPSILFLIGRGYIRKTNRKKKKKKKDENIQKKKKRAQDVTSNKGRNEGARIVIEFYPLEKGE